MNENARPTRPDSESTPGESVQGTWFTIRRAASLGIAWTPVLGALVWFIPKFDPIFIKLHEKGELPLLTVFVMTISNAIRSPFGLPALLALVVLLLVDVGVRRALGRSLIGRLLDGVWFGTLIATAALAVVLVLAALKLPVFKMGSNVVHVRSRALNDTVNHVF
jgi:type II secretory pathway component PulF